MLPGLANLEKKPYMNKRRATAGKLGRLRSKILIALTVGCGLAAGASAQDAATDAYRISPEDLLEISVWREPELQKEVIVRPDGGISFPLVGDIQAAGRTPEELAEAMAVRVRAYIPDAVVTVSVQELRGLRIYVSGNVENPGQYTVGRYVDVLQAIAMAGGLTPFADAADIRVIRRIGGRERVFEFNYREVQRGRNLQQNIRLEPDDVVVVP